MNPIRSIAIMMAIACSWGVACGGRVGVDDMIYGTPACVPGQQVTCACPGGGSGVQACLRNGTFESCQCGGLSTTGSSSGSTGSSGTGSTGTIGTGPTSSSSTGSTGSGGITPGAGGATGGTSSTGAGGSDAGPALSGTQLSGGMSQLIDVFVGEAGVYIVLQDAVQMLDRSGGVKKSIPSPRQITTAAFDGRILVVADRARLTTYDLSLAEIASGDLGEECASSVLVGGDRFVCGPKNDWDRVFYTYASSTGSLVASSKKYTYNGIPMKRIPGKNDFVTVSGGSPSDFHLYSVLDSGEAMFVNESPYHGDFRITTTYAFDGSPPVHLVTDAGLMLRIYGDNCAAGNSFTSTCFVKDGALGTLTGAQLFVAMTEDAGKIYGLVATAPDNFGQQACKGGCLLERIDPVARSIETKSLVQLDIGSAVAMRRDVAGRAIVLGFRIGSTNPSSIAPYPGYRVVLFPD